MEPEGSLPHSHVPITSPYPKSYQSSPWLPSHFLKSISVLSSHVHLGPPSGLFPSRFPTKTLYVPLLSPIHAKFPAYPIISWFDHPNDIWW